MSTYISRRRVVAGAAWAAPVIATSAAVPAFAASLDCVFAESPHKFLRGYSDYRVEEEFTVPANVHRIRFDIFGGGGVSDTYHESGSGARAIGIVEVKPARRFVSLLVAAPVTPALPIRLVLRLAAGTRRAWLRRRRRRTSIHHACRSGG